MSKQPDVVKALEILSEMEQAVETSPGLLGKRLVNEEIFFTLAMQLRVALADQSPGARPNQPMQNRS